MARTPQFSAAGYKEGIKKTGVAVEMFGMDDFLRQLRKAPAETRKAVSHGSREIAKTVLVQVKRRARMVPHASQYQTIIPSLKTPVGPVPKIQAGGSKKAATHRRMIDGKKKLPPSGDIFFGVEFGGGRRSTTRQFPRHRGKKGYVLFPTIIRMQGFIKKEYTKQIDDVLKGLTR
tara:strand:- start:208 stop:732 length:525 start_codon:yes stop_codon:yes gene_type:complete